MSSLWSQPTFIEDAGRNKNKRKMRLYKCNNRECNNIFVGEIYRVENQKTRSCGCLKTGNPTHNMSKTSEYRIWQGIKKRCYNPKHKQYHRYGGRGITVCDRWLDKAKGFANFYEDMGSRPFLKAQIDRIDNSKGYCKENCRWTTNKINCNNQDRNYNITHNGVTRTLSEWASITGIEAETISTRIKKWGWSIEKALTEPTAKLFELYGKQWTYKELSMQFGVSEKLIRERILRGLSVEDAISKEKYGSMGFTHDGKTQSLTAWSREIGVSNGTLRNRMKKGMSFEQAITTPKRPGAKL